MEQETEQEQTVDTRVIRDLSVQLLNLTLQKAYVDAEMVAMQEQNAELRGKVALLEDELRSADAKSPSQSG